MRDPYYTDGVNVTLYHGDAREVLRDLAHDWDNPKPFDEEGTVADVVFIDAPNLGNRDFDPVMIELAMELSQREVVAVAGHKGLFQLRNLFRVRGVMAWHANNVDRSPFYAARPDVGFVLWGSYEGRRMFGKLLGTERWPSSLFMHPKPERPDELPVELVSAIMDGYPGEASFLDPFAGYGSTLVAAARQGRQVIGIEIDERRCEITAERLEAEGPAMSRGERYYAENKRDPQGTLTPGGGP